jgi:hypothetical protein
MVLLMRHRYPRIANILGCVSGVITLAIGIACGASTTILILGGASSVLLGSFATSASVTLGWSPPAAPPPRRGLVGCEQAWVAGLRGCREDRRISQP